MTPVIPLVASVCVLREGISIYSLMTLRCALAKSCNIKTDQYASSGSRLLEFWYKNANLVRSSLASSHALYCGYRDTKSRMRTIAVEPKLLRHLEMRCAIWK